MDKKGLLVLVFVLALMLCFPLIGFSETPTNDSALVDPPSDGIFNLGDYNIKFIPPKGWKTLKQDSPIRGYPSIHFMFPDSFWKPSLYISIAPIPFIPSKTLLEGILKDETSRDANVLEQQIIKFADTDAATWTTKLDTRKMKQIRFFKDTNIVMISFDAEEKNFDKLLPAVDESLKSFEIISPVPK